MATRAERLRATSQRKGLTRKARKKASNRKSREQKHGPKQPMSHAEHKATYALETHSKTSRASRKSTRASANRIKADTNLNLREEMTKGSPEMRARKARSRATRVRGGPHR